MIKNGAPYLWSNSEVEDRIVSFSGVKRNEKVIDIGSGDGRIVKAFARFGCRSYGIELNPLLVWFTRWKLRPYSTSVIYNADLWSHDYSPYDIVYVYGMPHLMQRLQTKLRKELKPGAKVITNAFKFPDWQEAQNDGRLSLYIQTNTLL